MSLGISPKAEGNETKIDTVGKACHISKNFHEDSVRGSCVPFVGSNRIDSVGSPGAVSKEEIYSYA